MASIEIEQIPMEQLSPEAYPSSNQQTRRNVVSDVQTSRRIYKHMGLATTPLTAQVRRFRVRINNFCSKHRSFIIAVRIALFIIVSMTIGILTVCFTAPKESSQTCGFVIKSIDQSSMSENSYPRAVIAHDFNNDSKLDIAVANSGTNNIGIFLGKGDGTLSSQATYPTGTDSQPVSLAAGDFNNDRQLDIVVANFAAHNIGIFLGNGDGTFTNQTTFFTRSSRPLWVTVGDFDNDSRLDIVIINYGTNSIGVLLGYDNGSFTAQIILSAPYDSTPFTAVVGDFNNDDKLDIAVANHGTHNIMILLGDGNGSFPIQITSLTGIGSQPYAMAVADFNNDTKLDVVVANYGTDNVCVLFGYGNGTFVIQETYSTGNNSKPVLVAVNDFDHDNRLDIAVSNSGTNNVKVFLGYSNGTFTSQKSFSTGLSSKPYHVVGGDFNNDGRIDIVVTNYGTNVVDILLAYINISFSSQTTYSTGLNSNPKSVVVGDFNSDRILDVVVANAGNQNIDLFIGNGDGDGAFSSEKTYSIDDATDLSAITVGDFNSDNLSDIVVAYSTDNGEQIGIFLGYSNGTLSNLIIYNHYVDCNPISIAVGDFNNDSRLDIVIACYSYGSVGVLLGNDDGTFSNTVGYSLYSDLTPQSIAVGDFNNDSQLDIVIADEAGSNVAVALGNGDGTFSDQMTFSLGYDAQPQSVAVGDFNNDSRLDIVVANLHTVNAGVLLGYGNGTFSDQKTHSTGIDSNPLFVTVGDFNNDSRLDILVANTAIDAIAVFLGNGDGTFSNQLSYSTGSGSKPIWIATGDFNEDSLMDVAIANSGNNNIGIMLGVANVYFTSNVTFSTGSSPGPRCVVISDLNNDKRVDIVVVNSITNNVGIFLADENGSYSMQITYPTGSLSSPTSLIVADFNNDMQLDIAVSNSGVDNIGIFLGYKNGTFERQTTYSVADGSNPKSITSGDFNNDDRQDIVVANYANDNVNVLLSSSGGLFKTEIPYSTGSSSKPNAIAVGDINNNRILDIVVANNGKANIGVFIGNGDGTFASEKTYSYDAGSYPVAVAIGDFNNDSRPDIVVADNVAFLIVILLQNEAGDFSEYESYGTGDNSWPTTVVVGDFNNDTRLDIIVGNYQTNDMYVFLGIGDGTFSDSNTYQIGYDAGLRSIAIGDLNNDSRLDIVIANTVDQSVDIRLGNGDGTFSDQTNYPTNTRSLPLSVAIGDFDNDGRLDIVVANQGSDNVGVLFGYGNGTFQNQVTFSTGTGSQPTSVAVGDFNNDGRLDIAVANSNNGNVGVLLGNVNRTFFSQIILLTDNRFALPNFVVVGHFNNDSRLNIAVCNKGSETVGIFLALAGDTFLNVPPYSTGPSSQPTYVTTADLNNDTQLDIVVTNFGTNNVMILLGAGYGTISSETTYSTGIHSQPCWVAIGDLNNDNRLDIVVANSGNDNVGILLGYGNGSFTSQITYSTGVKSQPSSVIIGDFNNDTRLDIAVANYGSNTVGLFFGYGNGSFASQILFSAGFDSRPLALASGDVNNDNLSDIVIANNGYGNIQILLKQC